MQFVLMINRLFIFAKNLKSFPWALKPKLWVVYTLQHSQNLHHQKRLFSCSCHPPLTTHHLVMKQGQMLWSCLCLACSHGSESTKRPTEANRSVKAYHSCTTNNYYCHQHWHYHKQSIDLNPMPKLPHSILSITEPILILSDSLLAKN